MYVVLVNRAELIGWENDSDCEVLLKKFDLDMSYGPCVGMTRLYRWRRAHKLGLNPPNIIKQLLTQDNQKNTSLWHSQTPSSQ